MEKENPADISAVTAILIAAINGCQQRLHLPRFRNSGSKIKSRVKENSCRQSRLCRLLENPIAFAVVQLLAENKELNPSEIARAVGRSVQRVSTVLSALHLAEVVRYVICTA